MIVALSPDSSDIIGLRPWLPIATGSNLGAPKHFKLLLRRMAPLTFVIRVQAFRDNLRGELPHIQIFMIPNRSLEMPSCSAINLAEIRLSS